MAAFGPRAPPVRSENIALGRISKDFELLRLGTPTYDEFAAWRYGDQFGLRRRRAMRYGGAVALASGVSLTGFVLLGAPRCIDLTGSEIERAQLTPGPSGTWSLRIPQPSWIPLPSHRRWVTLADDDAISAAGRLLQRVNSFAATADVVRDAVTFLRSSGSAHEAFARAPPQRAPRI